MSFFIFKAFKPLTGTCSLDKITMKYNKHATADIERNVTLSSASVTVFDVNCGGKKWWSDPVDP